MRAPEAAARLFSGRPLSAGEPPHFADWLSSRRLAAELAALPELEALGLGRDTRRRLAVAREATRAAAETRRPALRRAARALADAGIATWAYKGEAFVRLTHGDPSRRPMADLDLVVLPDSRERARRALVQAGLTDTPHATALHEVLVDEGARGPGHPHGVAVELHSDVFPPPHPFSWDLKQVLVRARPSEIPGLLIPSAEDCLLLHAFHLLLFEQDSRKSLIALRDVALLGERCDEELLRRRAGDWGLSAVVDAVRARAAARAGGREPGGAPALERGRRGLALRLTARELDASLEDDSLEPPPRALSRRFAAALWQPRFADFARAAWKGARGRGALGRWRRHVGALGS